MNGNGSTTAVRFLTDLRRASLNSYDKAAAERLRKARAVLFAMPETDRLWFAGVCTELIDGVAAQGMGTVVAFEIVLSLGDLLERKTDGRDRQ